MSQKIKKKIKAENKKQIVKKTPIYKSPSFESFRFYSKQVAMLYMTNVTCDSVQFLITSDIKMISS